MLPDFLIIGAPKAGTTWLVRCLRRHPRVFLPQAEIHYWSNPSLIDAGHTWYRKKFKDAAPGQVIGERSNSYLTQPEVADLIVRNLPKVKLVVNLRNPIDRAYSGYCMRLRHGDVTEDVNLYLDPEGSLCPDILHNSLYHEKLKPYLARFPVSQMHFFVFDDIKHRPANALTDLCRFLGIEPLVTQMLVDENVNPKEKRRLPTPVLRWARHFEGVRHLLGRVLWLIPFGNLARNALLRQRAYPTLPATLRDRMAAYFRSDLQQLSTIVGRDLGSWIGDAGAGAARSPSAGSS